MISKRLFQQYYFSRSIENMSHHLVNFILVLCEHFWKKGCMIVIHTLIWNSSVLLHDHIIWLTTIWHIVCSCVLQTRSAYWRISSRNLECIDIPLSSVFSCLISWWPAVLFAFSWPSGWHSVCLFERENLVFCNQCHIITVL